MTCCWFYTALYRQPSIGHRWKASTASPKHVGLAQLYPILFSSISVVHERDQLSLQLPRPHKASRLARCISCHLLAEGPRPSESGQPQLKRCEAEVDDSVNMRFANVHLQCRPTHVQLLQERLESRWIPCLFHAAPTRRPGSARSAVACRLALL